MNHAKDGAVKQGQADGSPGLTKGFADIPYGELEGLAASVGTNTSDEVWETSRSPSHHAVYGVHT